MKKDIYIIKNTLNDKVYVGQAQDSAERWKKHISNSRHRKDTVIDKAIHKYGIDKFYYQILEYQIEDYDEKEKYWIKRYNSIVPNGYNVAAGGRGIGAGIDNPSATVKDQDTLKSIIEDLRNSKTSNVKLAKKYGCSEWTIFAINNGKAYYDENINYPIRESNRYSEEKLKQLRYALKYELDKSIKQLSQEFDMDCGEISNINQGKTHRLKNEKYPLRSGKVLNPAGQIVDDVISLLKTDMSQKDIARKFNVSVNSISMINLGKSYRKQSEQYPIRQNYQGDSKRNCFSPDEIINIEKALRENKKSMRDIASEFECSITNIMNINNGVIKKYHNKNVKYPIRNSFCNDYPRIAE